VLIRSLTRPSLSSARSATAPSPVN
jgi:antitoxin MazE